MEKLRSNAALASQHMTIRQILITIICCSSFAVKAAEDDGDRYAHLPQFPALKAKIYGNVGARGYVVNTDARGKIVETTDSADYRIQNIEYNKDTNLANDHSDR